MSVTYAGHFKNNIGGPIPYAYNSKEFQDFVSQFKFVVSMENSQEETYITEKITHGLIGGSIPVYWGSKRVAEYFNKDRILTVDDETCIDAVVQTMKTMNADTWLQKANSRCLPQGRGYGVNDIARQIKSVFYPNPFPLLTHIYIICNPEFEPVRHQRLQQMCAAMGLREHNYTFICPTYKHTITDDMYKEYVKNDLVVRMRPAPMKRSELSLFLNFRAVFEHAVMHYKEGMVLTLESDVYLKPNYGGLGQCLEVLQNKQWDCIHLGGASPSEQPVPFINGETPYRAMPNAALLTANSSEELSPHEELRFSRRFHTRCTDTLLWKMSGCESFLRHMHNDTNYGAPFDYYFINKLENDMSFKHYWSYISYFDQASNNKLEPSTIQSDMS